MKPLTAEFLISFNGDTTVLCRHHARTFEYVMAALNLDIEVYKILEDETAVENEEPVACQACLLSASPAQHNLLPH